MGKGKREVSVVGMVVAAARDVLVLTEIVTRREKNKQLCKLSDGQN